MKIFANNQVAFLKRILMLQLNSLTFFRSCPQESAFPWKIIEKCSPRLAPHQGSGPTTPPPRPVLTSPPKLSLLTAACEQSSSSRSSSAIIVHPPRHACFFVVFQCTVICDIVRTALNGHPYSIWWCCHCCTWIGTDLKTVVRF